MYINAGEFHIHCCCLSASVLAVAPRLRLFQLPGRVLNPCPTFSFAEFEVIRYKVHVRVTSLTPHIRYAYTNTHAYSFNNDD